MVFTHISVKGWIIDPYVQSLFYCPNLVHLHHMKQWEITTCQEFAITSANYHKKAITSATKDYK